MERKMDKLCFLCGESCDEISYQYTEPICEACLNFKGLTRIEAMIGNKRRLKSEGENAVTSVHEASPSSSSPTRAQFRKRISRSSVNTDYSIRNLYPGKKLISRTKRTESQMTKEVDGNNELLDDVFYQSTPISSEKETVLAECQLKSAEENCLGFVIPLPFKKNEISPNENIEREPPLHVPLLEKFQQDQMKISESFARAALVALHCGLSRKTSFTFCKLNHSPSRFDTPTTKKLNLKRSASDSGSTSRKK